MLSKLWTPLASGSKPELRKVLIIASLLATVPVLIMGAVAYFTASGRFIEEIREANRQTMLQIQQRIDEKLITLEKIALQNAVNPTLSRFVSLSNPEEDFETLGLTMTLLNSIQVLIEDIDAVYLYRPDQHLVVSPNRGLVGEEVLPEYVREAVSLNPSKVWLDHKLESELVRDGFHQVTFVRRINTSGQTPAGYLIVNLNDTAFFRVFSNMKLGSRELVIVTPSGNVFADGSSSLLQNPLAQYPFFQELMNSDEREMLMTEQVDGSPMSINYLKSNYNGWKYVTMIPYSDLTQHLQKIKQTTFLICLLLVLISVTATGVLSKRWYRALQSLMDLIKNKGGLAEAPHSQNEFAVIRHYFDSLHENNEILREQIQESMPLLRANFIQNLLTEPFHSSMIERAEYYNIPVQHAYYTVLCIELDNTRGHTEQDSNLFHYAVINISKEMISHHAEGLVIRMHNGHIAILINHDAEEPSLADLKTKSFLVAEEIRSVAESLLHITVTIGIGRSYEGLGQVRTSYGEALEALKYQLVEGSGRVLFVGQIKAETSSFAYPYDLEQQLLTCLKLANMDKISTLLDDFAQALRAEIVSHEHVRQSFIQLIAASLRALYEIDPNSTRVHDYNLYERLNELNTSDKIVGWLKAEVYPPMVGHINTRTASRNHSTIQKALDYMHEHYDTDLSMPQLASMISIPVSQFSHLFKVEVGMFFSEYLIALRMEKARELLETTDFKISDIAEKLRYNNSQNFIRVFKKMNGMTPGEYRTRHSKEKPEQKAAQGANK
ncbi:helix-turn-helix domain-containing protein [Paenibacillus mucilaginosus]|uniref:Transcriptional regulator, AraC family n=1 Tax=Paenibacillus mucilaginosus (strain KNP414) TaxID=1036673 RepID=F8FRJ4_PAEMK|nr:helix-turn-helix domain-containing protein [Paenibacillus mucilaginosus]AEI40551.1 transcriptional regulator, AraC family [Paenibacillus mucilaginosus KNP414]MCG7216310.1 helix-turn-helix domain-containing protein [Paenibacillus mucilaginosus]WDM29714.1 helix-turn-helix domain-containing protein [Paenibacillus mucilaginosus]